MVDNHIANTMGIQGFMSYESGTGRFWAKILKKIFEKKKNINN